MDGGRKSALFPHIVLFPLKSPFENQTIEPGVYFHPALLASYNVHTSPYIDTDVLARYEGMGGVRIEDDVLITETGCENLTKVQSNVEWVERVCAGEDLV